MYNCHWHCSFVFECILSFIVHSSFYTNITNICMYMRTFPAAKFTMFHWIQTLIMLNHQILRLFAFMHRISPSWRLVAEKITMKFETGSVDLQQANSCKTALITKSTAFTILFYAKSITLKLFDILSLLLKFINNIFLQISPF